MPSLFGGVMSFSYHSQRKVMCRIRILGSAKQYTSRDTLSLVRFGRSVKFSATIVFNDITNNKLSLSLSASLLPALNYLRLISSVLRVTSLTLIVFLFFALTLEPEPVYGASISSHHVLSDLTNHLETVLKEENAILQLSAPSLLLAQSLME